MEEFLAHAGGGCVRSGDSELWQDHREAQDQKSRYKRPEGQIHAEDKNESQHLRGIKSSVTKGKTVFVCNSISIFLSGQVTGPIDFQQLQLENAELIDVLRSKNAQVKKLTARSFAMHA